MVTSVPGAAFLAALAAIARECINMVNLIGAAKIPASLENASMRHRARTRGPASPAYPETAASRPVASS